MVRDSLTAEQSTIIKLCVSPPGSEDTHWPSCLTGFFSLLFKKYFCFSFVIPVKRFCDTVAGMFSLRRKSFTVLGQNLSDGL